MKSRAESRDPAPMPSISSDELMAALYMVLHEARRESKAAGRAVGLLEAAEIAVENGAPDLARRIREAAWK